MAELLLEGGPVEYHLIRGDEALPPLVLLHEGLGCVGTWRRFPALLAERTGRSVLSYSRHGYGGSGAARLPRPVSYLHDEARGALPELLERLGIGSPVLVGHSDGASIALVHAAERPVSGLVLVAPHVFVEPVTLAGIRTATEAFDRGVLRARLAAFHHDPDAAFRGWRDVWSSEQFRDWSIENLLSSVDCPVLAVQGTEDQYGTMRQLDAVERGAAGPVRRLELPGCGHAPHLQRTESLVTAIADFLTAAVGVITTRTGGGL